MTPAPTVPDVKAVVMALLGNALDCPVLSTRPAPEQMPERCVVVITTGGTGRVQRALTRAQITIDAYAPSTGTAVALALAVDRHVHAMPAQAGPVAAVEGTYPASLPDPVTAAHRATATYTITAHLL